MTQALLQLLDAPPSELAEVTCTPFPSPFFDRLVDDVQPALVVVDVTFLNEATVRPALMRRLASMRPILVFLTSTGYGWMDDLRDGQSGYIIDTSASGVFGLLARPQLHLVQG